MRNQFYLISFVVFLASALISAVWPPFAYTFWLTVPVFLIGVMDAFQNKHVIRRNFPVIGNFRYIFEKVRPELQQYFVESDLSGRPIPREYRSVVYQRAKGVLQSKAFGTMKDVEASDHEWVCHSMSPKKLEKEDMRIMVGGPGCTKPYSLSLMNISAMSYGALSHTAISALNLGARDGNFAHNTGEGGISEFHKKGGDLVWQIGTGYFGCRNLDGTFNEDSFKEKSNLESVKMIEIKLSQGAKPGKGGLLPGEKVTKEIAEIRQVPLGQTVASPPKHSSFNNAKEMLQWIDKLRTLSGGKPVGIKLCVGKKEEFIALCKAMVELKLYPDFITVDGSQGGTGAAPLEFVNSVGVPLVEGLTFVKDCLVGFGIKEHIKIIAAGKIFTAFHVLRTIALGADAVNSGRGMMLALGCIHALTCNSNKCPAGVATTDRALANGIYVPDKAKRVARFHHETVDAFSELLGAMGYNDAFEIKREDVYRRLTDGVVKTFEDLYPSVEKDSFLNFQTIPERYKAYFLKADAESKYAS